MMKCEMWKVKSAMHPAYKKSTLENGLKWAQYSDCVYSTPIYFFCIEMLILQGNQFFLYLAKFQFIWGRAIARYTVCFTINDTTVIAYCPGYEVSSDLNHVAELSWSWDILDHVG